jgi:hypothetical protein
MHAYIKGCSQQRRLCSLTGEPMDHCCISIQIRLKGEPSVEAKPEEHELSDGFVFLLRPRMPVVDVAADFVVIHGIYQLRQSSAKRATGAMPG